MHGIIGLAIAGFVGLVASSVFQETVEGHYFNRALKIFNHGNKAVNVVRLPYVN